MMTAPNAAAFPVLFWGCNGESGHHLWAPEGRLKDLDCEHHALPTREHLDCNPMLLPHPERRGDAALTYLPTMNRTILAWWGNPWDPRGKTNNAVIVAGKVDEVELLRRFRSAFPLLSQKLQTPKIVSGSAFASDVPTKDWFLAGMVKELRRRGYRTDEDARTYAADLYRRTIDRGEIGEADLLAGDPVKFVTQDAASWSA